MMPERKGSADREVFTQVQTGGTQGPGVGSAAQTGPPGHRTGEGAQVHLEKLGRCGAQHQGPLPVDVGERMSGY